MKHTLSDLYQMQSLPLSAKIRMTEYRIRQWYEEYGGDVYVSFSGGKDSTVLLDVSRKLYPDIKAVFLDTGLEYPEIRDFVKTFDNVDWVRPKMTFKEVTEKYGYPFISKEVSQKVYEARNKPDGVAAKSFDGSRPKQYDYSKYAFLLEAPFKVGSRCCNVMKKNPAKQYEKQSGLKPIVATMASESKLRTQRWLESGCNAFDGERPISKPMSFWTEQDVLLYIQSNDIKIASVYGDIVVDFEAQGQVVGQMNVSDFGMHNPTEQLLKTTGCNRTGCMFCGYGCHIGNDDRFLRMKETHPKQYEYIMKSESDGGLGYRDKINWMNEKGNMNIRY